MSIEQLESTSDIEDEDRPYTYQVRRRSELREQFLMDTGLDIFTELYTYNDHCTEHDDFLA